MKVQKLMVKDVRCFADSQTFDIRPITFLVGENSTGKSTVLGCLKVLSDIVVNGLFRSDFNIEPHHMGAFSDIVRKNQSITETFTIGLEINLPTESYIRFFYTFNEKEKGSEPSISQIEIVLDDFIYTFNEKSSISRDKRVDEEHTFYVNEIIDEGSKLKFFVELQSEYFHLPFPFPWFIIDLADRKSVKQKSLSKHNERFVKHYRKNSDRIFKAISMNHAEIKTLSFAPIRSSPQRTYNALKETLNPEGSEIPNLMMNLSRTDSENWKRIKSRLQKFGTASGLFSDVSVRQLGESVADPFQLQIQVRGPNVNLIDVGYGVNQILPMLVRVFHSEQTSTFLMQQPEVHLHPKAQAELTSLLSEIANSEGKTFVIETHSDYMIDRIRIEIMKGKINADDVSLIYLEPTGSTVQVHNIKFDEQANLIGTPQNYREFFQKETNELLGFD